jgi:Superfamily II DNA helicase
MAEVQGVGAAKLEKYGRAFLEVILEAPAPREHPARVALASRGGGALFDRLREAELELRRGADGTGRPMSVANATLAKIAERRPGTPEALAAVPGMGEARTERFGPAFLSIIAAETG